MSNPPLIQMNDITKRFGGVTALQNGELPFMFLGRITVAHGQISKDEIDVLEKEACHFSGVGALKR